MSMDMSVIFLPFKILMTIRIRFEERQGRNGQELLHMKENENNRLGAYKCPRVPNGQLRFCSHAFIYVQQRLHALILSFDRLRMYLLANVTGN